MGIIGLQNRCQPFESSFFKIMDSLHIKNYMSLKKIMSVASHFKEKSNRKNHYSPIFRYNPDQSLFSLYINEDSFIVNSLNELIKALQTEKNTQVS